MTVRSLNQLVRSYELSSYRENLLEQLFCSELLQGAWLAGLAPLELDRPFVDFQGYDLVATCGQVSRHIQLKATHGRIAIHRNLALKPSACVINLDAVAAGEPERLVLTYRLFAGAPGQALDLEGLRPAKKVFNTRSEDGSFSKAERPNHVQIPHSRFSKPMDIVALSRCLFGQVTTSSALQSEPADRQRP